MLILGVLILGMVVSRASAEPPEIDELKWIDPGFDPVEFLTVVPAECSATTTDPVRSHAVDLGRVAFRSPVLLGGLAARGGISCDSCHRNGHGNPAFHVTGVSSAVGTADVTGSVFSEVRDDHIFNPVPIPSLVDVAARSTFGTVRPTQDLASFVRAAVVDEFDGPSPSASIVDALVAYMVSLRSSDCPDPGRVRVSFESSAGELRETLGVVIGSLDRGDLWAARFSLLSFRAALGRVYRRFPESVVEREALVELSRSLSTLRFDELEESDESAPRALLRASRVRLNVLIEKLGARVKDSFFDRDRLRKSLRGPS